jgi:hypothetical protein
MPERETAKGRPMTWMLSMFWRLSALAKKNWKEFGKPKSHTKEKAKITVKAI